MEETQKLGNLFANEDLRQWLFSQDFDLGPDFPGLIKMIPVNGAKSAKGLIEGGTFVFDLCPKNKGLTAWQGGRRRLVLRGRVVS